MCLKPACFGYGHNDDDDDHYTPVADAPLAISMTSHQPAYWPQQRAGSGYGDGYGHGQQQGRRQGLVHYNDAGLGATTTREGHGFITSVAQQAAAAPYTYRAPDGTSKRAAARNYDHGEGRHGARYSEMGRY